MLSSDTRGLKLKNKKIRILLSQIIHFCVMDNFLFISVSIGKVQLSLWLTVTPEQIIYKEYLVYDAIGMIGSIGGSLGLCIGFSIFDTLCMFVDFALKKLKCT